MTVTNSPASQKLESSGIPEKQEATRGQLAKGFALGFGLMIILVLGYILFGGTLDTGRVQLINMLFNGLSGLVGTILGFYFGQNGK